MPSDSADFAGGRGLGGRHLPSGRFHALESGGLPTLEDLLAGNADHRLVEGRFPGGGFGAGGHGQSRGGRGRGGQKIASSQAKTHESASSIGEAVGKWASKYNRMIGPRTGAVKMTAGVVAEPQARTLTPGCCRFTLNLWTVNCSYARPA